jgi:hypothetical protein
MSSQVVVDTQSVGSRAHRLLGSGPNYNLGIFFGGAPNYGLLLHSALTLSLAAYSVHHIEQSEEEFSSSDLVRRGVIGLADQLTNRTLGSKNLPEGVKARNLDRAAYLARYAMGSLASEALQVSVLQSDRACGLSVFDPVHNVLVTSFRGTIDPADVVTDADFLRSPCASRASDSELDGGMQVHRGFLEVFLSVRDALDAIIDALDAKAADTPPRLIFTGHSMGGALAALAAVYYRHRTPCLVTFGAPSIGNAAFEQALSSGVQPFGGIRVWNELDTVPYLAQVVGYRHAGVREDFF